MKVATTKWNEENLAWDVIDVSTNEVILDNYDSSIEAEFEAKRLGYLIEE